MKRTLTFLPLLLLLIILSGTRVHADSIRVNRDTETVRDRNAILCDPINSPRGPRGEVLNCPSVPSPTSVVVSPTAVPTTPPTGGGTGGSSSGGDGGSSGGSNPCSSGQSFVGPYCGWSPSVSSGGGSSSTVAPRVGGPTVLGLSRTSSNNFGVSDIILALGVLCLLLYVRSLGAKRKI